MKKQIEKRVLEKVRKWYKLTESGFRDKHNLEVNVKDIDEKFFDKCMTKPVQKAISLTIAEVRKIVEDAFKKLHLHFDEVGKDYEEILGLAEKEALQKLGGESGK